jgi:hypothetical protein
MPASSSLIPLLQNTSKKTGSIEIRSYWGGIGASGHFGVGGARQSAEILCIIDSSSRDRFGENNGERERRETQT